MYVDLFLLWLLYRFTRPQKFLNDGRPVASAILFAHDNIKAGDGLVNSLLHNQEDKEAQKLRT